MSLVKTTTTIDVYTILSAMVEYAVARTKEFGQHQQPIYAPDTITYYLGTGRQSGKTTALKQILRQPPPSPRILVLGHHAHWAKVLNRETIMNQGNRISHTSYPHTKRDIEGLYDIIIVDDVAGVDVRARNTLIELSLSCRIPIPILFLGEVVQ